MHNPVPDAPAEPAAASAAPLPDASLAGAPALAPTDARQPVSAAPAVPSPGLEVEIGGPTGPEPTRYGDWERKGRCIDF